MNIEIYEYIEELQDLSVLITKEPENGFLLIRLKRLVNQLNNLVNDEFHEMEKEENEIEDLVKHNID